MRESHQTAEQERRRRPKKQLEKKRVATPQMTSPSNKEQLANSQFKSNQL